MLQDEVNADVSVDFVKAAGFDGAADADLSNLESIKAVIQRLRAPDILRQQLQTAFLEEGVSPLCHMVPCSIAPSTSTGSSLLFICPFSLHRRQSELCLLCVLQPSIFVQCYCARAEFQLHSMGMSAGLAWEDGQWEGSWAAIKRVWASKWNERAVLSLRRAGLSHSALQMAVLCQAVVPAQYAFVSHTTNPMTGEACYLMCAALNCVVDTDYRGVACHEAPNPSA